VPPPPPPKSATEIVEGRVGQGKLIVAPNTLEMAGASPWAWIIAKGKSGATVEFRVYAESGALVRTLSVVAEVGGVAKARFDGTNDSGAKLGSGLYWVVGSGGGVSDRKIVVIGQRRKP
jgi:flagellar hook assembly protein FlgD